MKASHAALSLSSSRCLASTCDSTRLGAPCCSSSTTAPTPPMERRLWLSVPSICRVCEKSSAFSVTAKSMSKGAICSRSASRCATSKSSASSRFPLARSIPAAYSSEAVQSLTASCARPSKTARGTQRYTRAMQPSARGSVGYQPRWASGWTSAAAARPVSGSADPPGEAAPRRAG
eukprot:scaffold24263_cov69-Phaeocystis_antarctica.AAC.14